MQLYTQAIQDPANINRLPWQQMQGWIEKFICAPHSQQNVIGVREHPAGGKVTQSHFNSADRAAHVCPFLVDAIEQDLFYIKECPDTDPMAIRRILKSQIEEFKTAAPPYDPIAAGELAGMPMGLKALLIFFPNYDPPARGSDLRVDQLFKLLIVHFLRQGLILGQFYRGCAEEAIHNPAWKNILTAPHLCWVVRYLQPHDNAFIKPGTPGWPIYQSLLPAHLRTASHRSA